MDRDSTFDFAVGLFIRVILALALAWFSMLGLRAVFAGTLTDKEPAPFCAEDDPCWDCETMGDRSCTRNK